MKGVGGRVKDLRGEYQPDCLRRRVPAALVSAPTPTTGALRRSAFAFLAALLFLLAHSNALAAGAKRVVVLKVDGLPFDAVERFVRERDPRTR